MSPSVLTRLTDGATAADGSTNEIERAEQRDRPCILFLHPGPAPLHSDPPYNMHFHLGKQLQGGAVYGSWAKTSSECAEWRTQVEPACGGFTYLPVPTLHAKPSFLRPLLAVFRMYREAIAFARGSQQRVEVVVGYSPYGVGLAAFLVSRRLGVPLIIQVQNDLRAAFAAQPGHSLGIKRAIASRLARFVLNRASGWHIYFEGQTGTLASGKDQRVHYLTDFTPVSMVPATTSERREFLLVGYPWSVKGADLAIRAFLGAGPALDDWTLRIVGHCPDRAPYEAIAAGDSRIVFESGMLHKQALDLIANCGVYVLASRTEAYGRVAIEAMAASRPIIATRVGGVPTYIQHEQTGLLVEPENVEQLSAALVRLATDEPLRKRLGAAGRARVDAKHMESQWVAKFANMVHDVLGTVK